MGKISVQSGERKQDSKVMRYIHLYVFEPYLGGLGLLNDESMVGNIKICFRLFIFYHFIVSSDKLFKFITNNVSQEISLVVLKKGMVKFNW